MEYYTSASFLLRTTREQADEILEEHQNNVDGNPRQEYVEHYGGDSMDVQMGAESVSVAHQPEGLWIYSEKGVSFDNDYAAFLIQRHLIRAAESGHDQGIVSWEYSLTASRPTLDAFGGGAVVVSADDIQLINTDTIMKDARKKWRLNGRLNALQRRSFRISWTRSGLVTRKTFENTLTLTKRFTNIFHRLPLT